MSSIYRRLAELSESGRRFAVATVVRTQGSTPQVVGAKLVVTDDERERPKGTLGGGCVEADAIRIRPFERLSRGTIRELDEEAERLAAFHGAKRVRDRSPRQRHSP